MLNSRLTMWLEKHPVGNAGIASRVRIVIPNKIGPLVVATKQVVQIRLDYQVCHTQASLFVLNYAYISKDQCSIWTGSLSAFELVAPGSFHVYSINGRGWTQS